MKGQTCEKRLCPCSDSYLTPKVLHLMWMMRCSSELVPHSLPLNTAIRKRIAQAGLRSISFVSPRQEACSPTISGFATSSLPQGHASRLYHRQAVLRQGLSTPSAFQPPPSPQHAIVADGVGERSLQQEHLPPLRLPVWERVWQWRWHSGTRAGSNLPLLLSLHPQRPR